MKVIIFDLWNTIAHHDYKSGSLSSICKKCYKDDYRTFLKSYETIFQTSKNLSFEKSFEGLQPSTHKCYLLLLLVKLMPMETH